MGRYRTYHRISRKTEEENVQPKVEIGQPGDKYEQEADATANRVMMMSNSEDEKVAMQPAEEQEGVSMKKSEDEVQMQPEGSDEEKVAMQPESEESENKISTAKEDEEPVNMKEEDEEGSVDMKAEDEKQVAMKEEDELASPQTDEDEVKTKTQDEEVKMKSAPAVSKPTPKSSSGAKSFASQSFTSQLNGSKGSGASLHPSVQQDLGPKMGSDFSDVKIHADANAHKMNKEIGAKAFTHKNHIYFKQGNYAPNTSTGKRLLAHELTHVIQQKSKAGSVQRQWIKDTGWRYKVPAAVKRSVTEIQAVVGTKVDGMYGPNTKAFVKKYQEKLKAKGLLTGAPNGLWDAATDTAHQAMATGNESETYNCSGLAFKTYGYHGMSATKSYLATINKLKNCTEVCKPYQHKFFFWEYDVSLTDLRTGHTTPSQTDFHIVGGQTDGKGKGPALVVSKNGARPVKGPKPPMAWYPTSDFARSNDKKDKKSPNLWKNRKNVKQTCYSSDKLPGH